VVSTCNEGGRNEFFHPAFVRFVPDDANSVSDAVAELIGENVRRQLTVDTGGFLGTYRL